MKIIVIAEAKTSTASPVAIFCSVIQHWQERMAHLFDPYQPELHYMRGPGPKWLETHGPSDHAL